MAIARSPVKPLVILALMAALVVLLLVMQSRPVMAPISPAFPAATSHPTSVSQPTTASDSVKPGSQSQVSRPSQSSVPSTGATRPIASHPEDAGPDVVYQPAVSNSNCGPAPCKR